MAAKLGYLGQASARPRLRQKRESVATLVLFHVLELVKWVKDKHDCEGHDEGTDSEAEQRQYPDD